MEQISEDTESRCGHVKVPFPALCTCGLPMGGYHQLAVALIEVIVVLFDLWKRHKLLRLHLQEI